MKPIALVTPWYGDDIRGGAEQECNYLAHSLTAAGALVEVFTTCVKEASCNRGINTIKSGVFLESGIPVRRFLVKNQHLDKYISANLRIYQNNCFTEEDEKVYFSEDINSPEMYKYIRENKENYHCFLFIPYMYGITFNGSSECMEKAILIPCLHDESYAYMQILKKKMRGFQGLIFLSKPEYELAHQLYTLDGNKTAVLGAGLDTNWSVECNVQAFRDKFKIQDPFILFAGRKDSGKKADELVDYFTRYRNANKRSNLKLVMIGGGSLEIPSSMKEEILDLGFVSVEDKHNALAAAEFLCNPSHFESFSIVIMESWVAKRPVVVSEYCAVTQNFCLETNGGLYYGNFLEFCGCVDYILEHQQESKCMGENGYQYVMEHFTHKKIAENYLSFIKEVIN